ncbi:MAG: hypothetical protein ABIK09_04580 [Pseudomonadota bacterium]
MLILVLAGACGGEDRDNTCDPTKVECEGVCLFDPAEAEYRCTAACDPTVVDFCGEGFACEVISDQANRTACVAVVRLEGSVFDLLTDAPVVGALVMARNTGSSSASGVVTTAIDGTFAIEIPVVRNSHGDPATDDIYTFFVSARDYLSYPSLQRPVVPVTLTGFVPETSDDPHSAWRFSSPLTVIGLLPVKDSDLGLAAMSGQVTAAGGGALIVAECAAPPCPYGYTDLFGAFTLYNIPPGTYTVAAYRKGLYIEKKVVDVSEDDLAGIELTDVSFGGGSASGSVNIVNAPGGSKTSVVLIPESTFHETLVTGIVAPGLRAPAPPTAPNVSGAFSITGIPKGRYVVLAAYENDGLVRDPDPGISGTQVVHFEISATTTSLALDAFKITEALAIVSPGGNGPEAVTGPFSFVWKDDSSEDAYNLKLYDAYGDLVWEKQMDEGVSGGTNVDVPYDGPALVPGMTYQWKVVSYHKGGPIATTEDLRGVFYVE